MARWKIVILKLIEIFLFTECTVQNHCQSLERILMDYRASGSFVKEFISFIPHPLHRHAFLIFSRSLSFGCWLFVFLGCAGGFLTVVVGLNLQRLGVLPLILFLLARVNICNGNLVFPCKTTEVKFESTKWEVFVDDGFSSFVLILP